LVDGGAGIDAMFGGLDDDWYVVDEVDDAIVEYVNQGWDSIWSYALSYTLPANVENMFLYGSAVDGYGNGLDNLIQGNGYDNLLTGGEGTDTLYGLGGRDQLLGGSAWDFLYGGADADRLDGGVGDDYMWGGTGDDVYVVDNNYDRVYEAAGEGTDTVESRVYDYYLPDNVENLTLQLSARFGTGNDLNNVIRGTNEQNQLYGEAGNDSLYGLDGNDVLAGGAGDDYMEGGRGDDEYYVGSSGDYVLEWGNEGEDLVWSTISYTLSANVENLNLDNWGGGINGTGNTLNNDLRGNMYTNVLRGEDGDDDLDGGLGNDTMYGGRGADTFHVDQTGDVVVEYANQGIDQVIASVDYTLAVNVENLTMIGGASDASGNSLDNTIFGNSFNNNIEGLVGADRLHGYGGNDALWGDANDDILWGDAGADMLYGGTGLDWFVFGSIADTTDGVLHDHIMDFSSAQGDRIHLTDIDANSTAAGNQAFTYIGAAAFSGTAGQLNYVGGFVQGDTNGDRVADFMIEVNAFSLSATDFFL
jgi:trimeric autotransporter adhesin